MGNVIEKLEESFCVETAVLWNNPVDDGYGSFIFDAPIEIKCRWENKSEVMLGADGREFTCNSSLLVTQDVDLQGFMFRGTLADLAGEDLTKPQGIKNTYIINRFDKIPMVKSTTDFFRQVFLYYYGK